MYKRQVESGTPGLVDHWDRVPILVSGAEAKGWLNDLISQKVNAIAEGQATHGLILDGQGRVLHHFGIAALPSGLLLDVASEHADELQNYLQKMVFWAQVKVERLDMGLVGVLRKTRTPRANEAGEGAPEDLGDLPIHSWRVTHLGEMEELGLWIPRANFADSWDKLIHLTGARPTGAMAWNAWRILARKVDVLQDLDSRVIPHEVPEFVGPANHAATQLGSVSDGPSAHAVHLNKGCYRGQETVSRVQNLGKSPRVLVLLHIDGSAQKLPAVDSELLADGRTIGRVGSSVHDATYGPIALALVKRNLVEKIARAGSGAPSLTADGVDAAIDPDDLKVDDTARPGREAIRKLRGHP